MVSLSSSARRDRGGGRSPEGLNKSQACTLNPYPLRGLPLYFRAENTWGEKVTQACFYVSYVLMSIKNIRRAYIY